MSAERPLPERPLTWACWDRIRRRARWAHQARRSGAALMLAVTMTLGLESYHQYCVESRPWPQLLVDTFKVSVLLVPVLFGLVYGLTARWWTDPEVWWAPLHEDEVQAAEAHLVLNEPRLQWQAWKASSVPLLKRDRLAIEQVQGPC